jgi:hypothetical protein
MIFSYSEDPKIIKAVEFANDLFAGSHSFYLRIEHKKFDMTEASGKLVSFDLKYVWKAYPIQYKVYKPWWRWSRAIGYFSRKHPYRIHINFYKLRKMTVPQIVGNICHEMVHLADNQNECSIYGHGDNKNPNGVKNNTAPYWIGILGKQIAKEKI